MISPQMKTKFLSHMRPTLLEYDESKRNVCRGKFLGGTWDIDQI